MKAQAKYHLASGVIMLIAGALLALYTGNIHTPIITLSKVGVVLMALGALDLLYALYLAGKR